MSHPEQRYLDLDFDHYSITQSLNPEEWCMRKLGSIEHLARYGRPLYAVLAHMYNLTHVCIRWRANLSIPGMI